MRGSSLSPDGIDEEGVNVREKIEIRNAHYAA
jgi:hypothetical protein